MKRFFVKGLTATILVVALAFPPVTSVFAVSALAAGQPNQSCQAQPSSPGQSSSASGSPFNVNGTSGSVYAGQQPQNSQNPNSVSQYDVACTQVSSH